NFLYDRTVAPEGLRRGTTLRVFDELADNLWGSTFDYVKLDFQLGLFGQFFRTYPSASVRVVLTYPTSSTGVPITQLLRIGGSDLRGYFTDELHGDTLASVQLAEQVPLLRNIVLPWVGARFNLALAVFSDTAMVLERHPGGTTVVDLMQNKDVRAHLHSGAGAGLRVLLPGVAIPALRLDVSYGFDVASVAFNLSIATAVL
ncbi:MAG: BamA/TamA family outer membrane protein, partial [Myxococcota bacterium]